MDINKYIVKFLIKNKYCSLPGLGSFDLQKISAAISNDNGEVIPSKFKINFSHLGSIDDTFASFIANEENVSISNSSNNIKQYCIAAKEEIAQSGKFTIDHLGYLTSENNKIHFVQTDELDMGKWALPLPPIDTNLKKTTDKKLDFSYPAAKSTYKHKGSNIGRVWIPIVLVLIVLGAIATVAYRYYANKVDTSTLIENNTTEIPTTNTIATPTDTSQAASVSNSASTVANNNATPALASNGTNALYKVAVYSSTLESYATAKANKWKNYGNMTEVVKLNENFVVTILASHPTNDTTLLVDSLRRFFNPKGQVYILK